jgi:hypothetical protein
MKEKLMVKKTKVIAFRVNADEYEALSCLASQTHQSVGRLVYIALTSHIEAGTDLMNHYKKAAERKAKRLAKKEAASGL